MNNITVDFTKAIGKIKPMHAVNNGPYETLSFGTEDTGTMAPYREAKIPYARTHDASFFSNFGGEHTVDVWAIFKNPDNDPCDTASYDFALTDMYLDRLQRVGTKPFYRLGCKIEHWPKKYGTLPPPDFKKWAVICEHIIKHYTEGWADGFNMNIEYWEIWNEPNLPGYRCWGGTPEEFYELYAISAKHLKKCFPHLKIGGPAMAGVDEEWMKGFLEYISKDREIALDFFSWHHYVFKPEELLQDSEIVRKYLDEYGYQDVENICNEWNYVKDWEERFVESLKILKTYKGAAFVSACMCACHESDIDMLMYYDASPCLWNGLFTEHHEILKPYYSIKTFSDLYEKGNQAELKNGIENVYSLAAFDDKEGSLLLSYYNDDDITFTKTFDVNLNGACGKVEVYLIDENHDCEKVQEIYKDSFTLTMKPNTVMFIKTAIK